VLGMALHPDEPGAGMVVADGSPLPSPRAHTSASLMPSCSKAQWGKFRAQASCFRVQPHVSSTENTFTRMYFLHNERAALCVGR